MLFAIAGKTIKTFCFSTKTTFYNFEYLPIIKTNFLAKIFSCHNF